MGNCISKINKDYLLDLKQYFKNKASFGKGRVRSVFDIIIGGGYTRIHSIEKTYSKTLAPLQAGAW